MKREIKFRAWDKKDIVYFVLADLEQNETLGASKTVDLDKCEIMQYTGLKDKKGVDVFEGDILKVYKRTRPSSISDVVFRVGIFQIKEEKPLAYYTPEQLEIIGNIYENPEFLKL